MTRSPMANEKQISVEEGGRVLAEATVSVADENGQASAQVHVASGHLPVGTRQKVADAVHEAVVAEHTQRLTATVPLGDAELVEGIRSHLDDVQLRAAGATSILEGDVKPD
jgi:ribulose-5-phosphate 4-epimerase/fuculose-1-phosphate aldolase